MVLPRLKAPELALTIYDGDLPPADDPFFYGWREVPRLVNGTYEWVQQPLTLADVLHPRSGDHIVQSKNHYDACDRLLDGLKEFLANEEHTVLLHDTLIHWGSDIVKPMCPDIAVVRDVQIRFDTGDFYLTPSGGRVDMVVEVTSRSTWKVNMDGTREPNKVQRYAQAGVLYYIIVDDVHQQKGKAAPLIVYRLGEGNCYEQMQPDEHGRYWIASMQLFVGPYQEWIAWFNGDGTRFVTHVEAVAARNLAEEQVRYATEQIRTEIEARKIAEEKVQYETDARQRAEERIRELEALLRASR